MTLNDASVPSLEEIRQKTLNAFCVRPCLWQLKVVEAILQGEKHIISIAGTGMGKTLTFWMPLLFQPPVQFHGKNVCPYMLGHLI
jgi:superfamily II DNA/RNA helicase